MTSWVLPRLLVEPIVRAALIEDLGRAGDLTTDAIVEGECLTSMAIVARQEGVISGLDAAALAFGLIDPAVSVVPILSDGVVVKRGEVIAEVTGPARGVLSAERAALNFLCRLSGVATATASFVSALRGQHARIVCTRKTTPGLRMLEKQAVRHGGGSNHRFGLDDAVLIKDNHIAIAGDISTAVRRVRERVGHLVKVEVEVDDLHQLDLALTAGVDAILLDNFSIPELDEAVSRVARRAITEASGGITVSNVSEVAATGVDLISVGWLTHSAPALDIGLDYRG